MFSVTGWLVSDAQRVQSNVIPKFNPPTNVIVHTALAQISYDLFALSREHFAVNSTHLQATLFMAR